jgi:hypothetical protein
MNSATRYDDVLPRFASLVEKELGPESLFDHLFLRDATGRVNGQAYEPEVPV